MQQPCRSGPWGPGPRPARSPSEEGEGEGDTVEVIETPFLGHFSRACVSSDGRWLATLNGDAGHGTVGLQELATGTVVIDAVPTDEDGELRF